MTSQNRRQVPSFWAMALTAAVVAAGISGCSSGPQRAASHSATAEVSPSRPLRVTVPGVATVTAPAGSFRGRGTITVAPVRAVRASLPYGTSLSAAGTGIDVTFSGVTVSRPLTITFDVADRPAAADVPVVAHRLPDGGWSLALATVSAGRMTVRAQTLSLHLPAWLDARGWMQWLGNRLASVIAGRTPPINCPGGPPWASVSELTDETHACVVRNADQASHAMRAEVQIKSNRGVALAVDIPPGADYTSVQDQPWAVRSWIWRHVIHHDPNIMVLLPAGATLTAGYRQPAANEDLAFQVNVGYWSLAYSLIGDIVDGLSGQAADTTDMATLYLMSKCSGAVDYGTLSVRNPLSTAIFGSAMTCIVKEALSSLSDPRTAREAARSLLGAGASHADQAAATRELASVGAKLGAFGWLVSQWPVLQLGWGGTADIVQNLLTDGTSTLITLDLRAAPAPTQKIYVSAVDSQGILAAGLQVTSTAGHASCEPGSEAIGLAYRCFAANGVHDPCWAGAQAAAPSVLCLRSPWSGNVTKLAVNGKLAPLRGSAGNVPPWGLQLTDGQKCLLVQGTHDSFDGRAVDYYCNSGEVVLHGLNTTGAQWRAQTAFDTGGQYSMGHAKGITVAWFGVPGRS